MKDSRVQYYIDIARAVSEASTCARRKFGAIIVKNDAPVSTGYNGSARGALNCGVDIPCIKDLYDEPALLSYNQCPAIHAEQNAIINAARNGVSVFDGTLFLSPEYDENGDRPCYLCRRMMINAGIKDCYYMKDGLIIHEEVSSWILFENTWMEKLLEEKRK